MKKKVIGVVGIGTTLLLAESKGLQLVDKITEEADRSLTITKNTLALEGELPETRQQRRKRERNKKK